MKAIFLTPLVLLACAGTNTETPPSMPDGYSYENLQEIELEKELEEISGIEYDGGKTFLAHNDEEGVIYRLNGEYKITETFSFAEDGDYEEIKKAGNALFVLGSKGDLWSMDYDGTTISTAEEHEWPGKKAEFEAMFYNETADQLILLCKNSKDGKEARATLGYSFNLAEGDPAESRFSEDAVFSLGWDAVEKATGKELKNLHPSANAVHPLTGEIYLLASMERLLLILTPDQAIKTVHKLDKERFPQAEGITFDEQGNMYISNEAADAGEATLLVFPYQTAG